LDRFAFADTRRRTRASTLCDGEYDGFCRECCRPETRIMLCGAHSEAYLGSQGTKIDLDVVIVPAHAGAHRTRVVTTIPLTCKRQSVC